MKRRIISGNFTLQSGETFPGKLKVHGHKSVLTIYCGNVKTYVIENQTIHGTSYEGEKITLIDCISPGPTIRFQSVTWKFYSSYILLGKRAVFPDTTRITRARFRTRDMATALYDARDFHYKRMEQNSAKALLEEDALRRVNVGDYPQICYFSGNYVVFEVSTVVGRVWIENSPSTIIGNPNGLKIHNKVFVNVEFETGLILDEAITVIQDLACLMSVIAGCTQRAKSVKIYLDETERLSLLTTVEQSLEEDCIYIHRSDLPIDPVRKPEEFCRVMQQWLLRHKEWHIPRYRWAACKIKGSLYDIDRVVAAANMLDILPEGANPKSNTLTQELMEAKVASKAMFKKLSNSPERESVLSALGRLAKPSLSRKCRYRISIIEGAMRPSLPHLAFVTNIAIKVRNYFVHGSRFPNLDETLKLVPFLTETLEFVFITSDLIECGWQISDWQSQNLGSGHSMSRYINSYLTHWKELRDIHPDIDL